jgi:hypothetical protein
MLQSGPIMRSLKKFKSFEEARAADTKSHIRRTFDAVRTEQFLQQHKGVISNPYRPGLYKFKTFAEARAYDIDCYARKAAQKKK